MLRKNGHVVSDVPYSKHDDIGDIKDTMGDILDMLKRSNTVNNT